MFNTQSHALGHTSSTVDAPKQFALICMYVCVRRSNSTKTASGIFSFTFWLLLDLLGRCFRCLFLVVRFVVLLLHRTHTHTHMLANICMHISVSIRHLIHTYHTHLFMALFSISVRQLFWLEYSLVVCFHFSSTHCLLPFLDVFDLLLRNGKPNNSVNGGASRMQQCKQ